MAIREALTGQYRAGLAMLRETIERCPDDLWEAGEHPRATWRIAYHALFYTHLYLMPDEEAFRPWPRDEWHAPILEVADLGKDPARVPPRETTYRQADVLEYLDWLDGEVEGMVNALDLDSPESGFSWYAIPKLDHQMLNVRHLQGHVGQMSELLLARGIDTDWVTRR
jgi:hypothetical protein